MKTLSISFSFMILIIYVFMPFLGFTQPVLVTDSEKSMPNEWIDKDTHHKVICLSRMEESISTLNADETMLAGGWAGDVQKEILKKYPEKSQFSNRIFDAQVLNQLFTLNIKTGEL